VNGIYATSRAFCEFRASVWIGNEIERWAKELGLFGNLAANHSEKKNGPDQAPGPGIP